jgi:hypothetical protein
MTTQRFKTIIEKSGTRTFITVPFDPNDVWGSKQRHHVAGTINDCAVRGPLDSDGIIFFLPLGAAWRRDNNLDAGAAVDVVLAVEGPQVDLLEPDVAAALEAEPQAKAFFEALPTFYRKNYMRWIDSAKRPETRAARIETMLSLLKAGKREKS